MLQDPNGILDSLPEDALNDQDLRVKKKAAGEDDKEIWRKMTRWWFQIFFIFTPNLGEDSHFG